MKQRSPTLQFKAEHGHPTQAASDYPSAFFETKNPNSRNRRVNNITFTPLT